MTDAQQESQQARVLHFSYVFNDGNISRPTPRIRTRMEIVDHPPRVPPSPVPPDLDHYRLCVRGNHIPTKHDVGNSRITANQYLVFIAGMETLFA